MKLLEELKTICYKTGIEGFYFESEKALFEAKQKLDAVLDSLLTDNKVLKLWSFNLPPGCTCPGKTPYCKKECYGTKGMYAMHGGETGKIGKGLKRRWDATKHPDFVRAMVRQIRGKVKYKNYPIRIHSTGDMYSVPYFKKWLKIIEELPDKQFYLYTRMWRVGTPWRKRLDAAEAKYPNLLIHWSTDPSSGVPEEASRRAFIYDPKYKIYHRLMPDPNCLKQLTKDGEEKMSCAVCKRCTTKGVGDVTLIKHPPQTLVTRVAKELGLYKPTMTSDEIEAELEKEKKRFKQGISRANKRYFESKMVESVLNESDLYRIICNDCMEEINEILECEE